VQLGWLGAQLVTFEMTVLNGAEVRLMSTPMVLAADAKASHLLLEPGEARSLLQLQATQRRAALDARTARVATRSRRNAGHDAADAPPPVVFEDGLGRRASTDTGCA